MSKFQTGVRSAYRAAGVFLRIGWFIFSAIALEVYMRLKRLSPSRQQLLRAKAISQCSQGALKFLNIQIELKQRNPLSDRNLGCLIVANHLSLWDILILSSHFNCLYITSLDIQDNPLLGFLTKLGGCVFVERRNRKQIAADIESVAELLSMGQQVALFPEATSSDGTGVLPFKRSLFRAAVKAGKPIVPVCINYRSIDDQPLSPSNRDRVFYYGEHRFSAQLAKIFACRSVVVEIEVFSPIFPTEFRDAHRVICDHSYELIRSHFDSIPGGILPGVMS